MEPLISVIIPTFNGARFIRETLNSVAAQTHRRLEIIVIDDGSSDGTAEVVKDYASRVTLLQQDHLGHPAARNRGIRSASGEFLSFLDHDDLWSPEKTASQLKCFIDDPGLDLVFGHIQNFFSPELCASERQRISSPMHPVPGLLQGAMLARPNAFQRVGLFSEERDMGDFLDWYGRALLEGLSIRMQSEVVLRRRIHTTNFQRTHSHLRLQYLPVLKRLLDQRRANSAETGAPHDAR